MCVVVGGRTLQNQLGMSFLFFSFVFCQPSSPPWTCLFDFVGIEVMSVKFFSAVTPPI